MSNLDAVKRIRDPICKGCLTYEDMDTHGVYCNIPHKKNGRTCPCSTCLVKGVCEEICDEVLAYKGAQYKRAKKRKPRELIADYTWNHP